MKRVGADAQSVTFQLTSREREALTGVLKTYPVIPPEHHATSSGSGDPQVAESQRLLGEALAEQRAANRRHLQAWLAAPDRFAPTGSACRLKLDRADCEWMLQVLNDIRVGNWLKLGSPDIGEQSPLKIAPDLLPAWMGLHLGGHFQMSILEALED